MCSVFKALIKLAHILLLSLEIEANTLEYSFSVQCKRNRNIYNLCHNNPTSYNLHQGSNSKSVEEMFGNVDYGLILIKQDVKN